MKVSSGARGRGWRTIVLVLLAAGCTGPTDKGRMPPSVSGSGGTGGKDKPAPDAVKENAPTKPTSGAPASAEKKGASATPESARTQTTQPPDTSLARRLFASEEHGSKVECVAFSPDGKTLATGSGDKTIRLWEVSTGKPLNLFTTGAKVGALAYAPDGQTLAAATHDGNITFWDVAAGKERFKLATAKGAYVAFLAFAPDGQTLATIDHGAPEVKLWNLERRRVRSTLRGHAGGVRSVAFSADGKHALTAASDGVVRVWDLSTNSARTALVGHTGPASFAAFSPDGTSVASGGEDKLVILWDTATGSRRATCEGHTRAVHYTAFTPDGKTVLSAGDDPDVRLWDAATGKPRDSFAWYSGTLTTNDYPTYFALSADGSRFATGSSYGVAVWDVSRIAK